MFEFITEWIRSHMEDPEVRERNEKQRLEQTSRLAEEITASRKKEHLPFFGYLHPKYSEHIYYKNWSAQQPQYSYTFQVTSKANCYESVLNILEKKTKH